MKKALLTGITGQDGAYLSQLLLEKGYKVYGTVRPAVPSNLSKIKFLGIEDKIEIIPSNLYNLQEVIRLIDTINPDEIYNLAAQSSVSLSFKQPIETVDFNVRSVLNLLEAIRILRLNVRFYQASSSEMCGKVKTLPVTEETILHPVSPYAISKATNHWLTVNYRESYGIYCCCGILFNHESFLRTSHFVTKKIVSTAVRINKGSDEKLKLGNISIKRDWGYAPEYVNAMWLMLQQKKADDYVISTGKAHSLENFTRLVFKQVGLNWSDHVIIDKTLYRPSEIDVIYGNSKKAQKKLNWKATVDFDSLIELLVRSELDYEADVADFKFFPNK